MRPFALKTLEDLPEHQLAHKTLWVRLDLNIPKTASGELGDLSRLHHALPTLEYLRSRTSRLILASHYGRPPEGASAAELQAYSLEPVGVELSRQLGCEVVLVRDVQSSSAAALFSRLGKNQIILLENLRFYPEEKQNNRAFSEVLARGVDYYINEAFGACHRRHSSVVGVPALLGKERCFAGWGLAQEVEVLSSLLSAPAAPFVVVMGGSKVADKMGALQGLLPHAQCVLIGGAMAYPFLALQGVKLGGAVCSDADQQRALMIEKSAARHKVKLVLPVDHITAAEVREDAAPEVSDDVDVSLQRYPLDIGPRTRELFRRHILGAATVLWNGPMGIFEWPNFAAGSQAVAQAVAQSPAISVVGGGDSLACVKACGAVDNIHHLSTGGGAMLAFLEHSMLPGLSYLRAAPPRHQGGLQDDDGS